MKKWITALLAALFLVLLAPAAMAVDYIRYVCPEKTDTFVYEHTLSGNVVTTAENYTLTLANPSVANVEMCIDREATYTKGSRGEIKKTTNYLRITITGTGSGNSNLKLDYKGTNVTNFTVKAGHRWGANDPVTQVYASYEAAGSRTYTCTSCGYVLTEEIPRKKRTINYVLNGGTNHPDNPSGFYIDETIVLKAPTRSGCTFLGWYKDQAMNQRVTQVTGNQNWTVYAMWRNSSLTGGMQLCPGKSGSYRYTHYTSASGDSTNTKDYAFVSSDPAVATVTLSRPTLSAYWQNGACENYLILTFNPLKEGTAIVDLLYKGSPLESISLTVAHSWGDWVTVTEATSTSDGMKKRTCSECGAEEEEVIPKPAAKITYQLSGGTNNAANPSEVPLGTTVTLKDPTRKGFTFKGWYTDPEMTKAVTKITVKADTTVYAKWKAHQYKVTFDGNGASSGSMNALDMKYGSSKELTANAFKRTGYKFTGWNTKKDGSGKSYANKESVKNLTDKDGGTVKLYAQWKIVSYSVSFDGNGATSGSMKALDMKYGTAKALTANAFKRTGYKFAGWNTKKDGSGTAYKNKESVKNLTTKDGDTVKLYAQWKGISYTVTFDGNGASSGSMKSLDMKYGSSKKLTANAFKRTGYKFAGWNTKKDGSGTAYKDKASVKNLTSKDGGTVKLYAQWKAISYSIVFNGNGATSGSMKALDMKYGSSKELPANAFKRKGYKFAGWNTKKDGSGKSYADKESVKNLVKKDGETITLYAQWKKKK